jgi:signal peptidase I
VRESVASRRGYESPRRSAPRSARTTVTMLQIAMLGVIPAIVSARRFLIITRVDGVSMIPTYAPGERLLVLRTPVGRPRRGDVVVARVRSHNSGESCRLVVKRLAAVAGDPVPAAVAPKTDGASEVPAGMVVLLGDGTRSEDSRAWGPVRRSQIIGLVIARLQPTRIRSAAGITRR